MRAYRDRYSLVSVILLLALPANADTDDPFRDGGTLLRACQRALVVADGAQARLTPTEFRSGLLCTGYVQGFLEGHDAAATFLAVKAYGGKVTASEVKRSSVICPPDGVRPTQAIEAVVTYLKQHPESLHVAARLLVRSALQEAFPCPH